MSKKHFIVVGAGLGGLATAARLAHRGHRVTVLEKNGTIGGRNQAITVNGCEFDGGPTLLMMLDPFKKLFADLGERFEDHLQITQCDPNYRVFFADGERIDATSNMARMIQEVQRVSGPEAAARYPEMIGKLGQLYHASISRFVRRNYDSVLDLASPKSAAIALKHGMLGNLAKMMAGFYDDPRLQILFCLQTMYLGLSPYDAPAVYGVLVYMEYGEGIWYPKGGLPEVSRAVAKLAESKGVQVLLNHSVVAIREGEVELTNGQIIKADAVICNADLPYADEKLAKPKKPRRATRHSCSAYMMYIDYAGELPGLLHHNIVLGGDFYKNLDQIFHRRELPDDPAFYAAITARAEPSKAPRGHENLFILVPYPNLDRPYTAADGCEIEARIFARLEKEFGFEPDRIRGMRTRTPIDWRDEFNLDKGAAFGLSHDFFQSVCFRPSNKSKHVKGLYYVGASTVPGNGLPMVLISAELAEKRLEADGLLG